MNRLAIPLALALVTALSGCAALGGGADVAALREEVRQLRHAVERAEAAAAAAQKVADEANQCCAASTERIDRAFKRSQK